MKISLILSTDRARPDQLRKFILHECTMDLLMVQIFHHEPMNANQIESKPKYSNK